MVRVRCDINSMRYSAKHVVSIISIPTKSPAQPRNFLETKLPKFIMKEPPLLLFPFHTPEKENLPCAIEKLFAKKIPRFGASGRRPELPLKGFILGGWGDFRINGVQGPISSLCRREPLFPSTDAFERPLGPCHAALGNEETILSHSHA